MFTLEYLSRDDGEWWFIDSSQDMRWLIELMAREVDYYPKHTHRIVDDDGKIWCAYAYSSKQPSDIRATIKRVISMLESVEKQILAVVPLDLPVTKRILRKAIDKLKEV